MVNKEDRKWMIKEQLGNHKVMNGIILALTLLLLGNMVAAGAAVAEDAKGYGNSENSFLWQLESGNYSAMLEMMYSNEAQGVKATETMKECYAVAEYFEAASYQLAYEKNDQEDKAVFYKEKMEDCKARMGTLAFAAEDIDQILKQKNRGEKND